MAESAKSEKPTKSASKDEAADHDRVAMLSVKADGTPDQHDPEIIGEEG